MKDTFSGFVQLEGTFKDYLFTRDSANAPVNPDAAPTYRVYGPSGLLASAQGTTSPVHTGTVTAASYLAGNITGATNATPIVITSNSHGLTNGMTVTVASVGGNTAANGRFVVANKATDTFELAGSVGNGSYTSGGTFVADITITSAAHGLANGMKVTITGVGGNTNANTTATVANKATDTFELSGVAGNSAYTSGGSFAATGFYSATFDATGANGFDVGKCYTILYSWAVSAAVRCVVHSFQVG